LLLKTIVFSENETIIFEKRLKNKRSNDGLTIVSKTINNCKSGRLMAARDSFSHCEAEKVLE